LPGALKAALKANRHLRSEQVLTRGRTGRRHPGAAREVDEARAAPGGMKVTNGGLHILRHTNCSRLAMLGVPVLAIKEQAGHASIMTTQRYMHLSPTAKRRAIELLDEMVGENEETAHGSVKIP
jgi:integrase